jgi:hypothetical protein
MLKFLGLASFTSLGAIKKQEEYDWVLKGKELVSLTKFKHKGVNVTEIIIDLGESKTAHLSYYSTIINGLVTFDVVSVRRKLVWLKDDKAPATHIDFDYQLEIVNRDPPLKYPREQPVDNTQFKCAKRRVVSKFEEYHNLSSSEDTPKTLFVVDETKDVPSDYFKGVYPGYCIRVIEVVPSKSWRQLDV